MYRIMLWRLAVGCETEIKEEFKKRRRRHA